MQIFRTAMSNSIYIILNQFKNEHITEEETVQLIEDLYRSRNIYVPTFPTWPQITYETPTFPKYEITCKQQ